MAEAAQRGERPPEQVQLDDFRRMLLRRIWMGHENDRIVFDFNGKSPGPTLSHYKGNYAHCAVDPNGAVSRTVGYLHREVASFVLGNASKDRKDMSMCSHPETPVWASGLFEATGRYITGLSWPKDGEDFITIETHVAEVDLD